MNFNFFTSIGSEVILTFITSIVLALLVLAYKKVGQFNNPFHTRDSQNIAAHKIQQAEQLAKELQNQHSLLAYIAIEIADGIRIVIIGSFIYLLFMSLMMSYSFYNLAECFKYPALFQICIRRHFNIISILPAIIVSIPIVCLVCAQFKATRAKRFIREAIESKKD